MRNLESREQYKNSVQNSIMTKEQKNKIYKRGIEKGAKRALMVGMVAILLTFATTALIAYSIGKSNGINAQPSISYDSYESGWNAVQKNKNTPITTNNNEQVTWIEWGDVAKDIAYGLDSESTCYHDVYTDLYGACKGVENIVGSKDTSTIIYNMDNIVKSCHYQGLTEYQNFSSLCELQGWINEEGSPDITSYYEGMQKYIGAQEQKEEAQKIIDKIQNPTEIKSQGKGSVK